jgi:hypothetical protein
MAGRLRVVIASPNSTESLALADWLIAEGFEPVRRSSARAAQDEIQAGGFDLLLVDAGFALRDGVYATYRARRLQTPAIVIGDTLADQGHAISRQAMYVPRPVERAMVMCTVSMALQDGRPVRCSTRKPVHRFGAVTNGAPAYIIDVSNEGLRLEMPRNRRSAPPPQFSVRVPMLGIDIAVQRMWARPWPGDGGLDVTQCGAALSPNQPRARNAWQVFVDTLPADGSMAGKIKIE